MNDSNAVLRIKDTTPGAIGVVHLPGRGDPTIPASSDRSKKSNKNNKKFADLKNLPCPYHKNAKHMVAECRQLPELGFYAKSNKGKGNEDNNKDGDDNADPGF